MACSGAMQAQQAIAPEMKARIDAAVSDVVQKTGVPSAEVGVVLDGRVAYTAAVMVLVVWLLKTGRPLGGLMIVPAAAIWLRHQAESGRMMDRARRIAELVEAAGSQPGVLAASAGGGSPE